MRQATNQLPQLGSLTALHTLQLSHLSWQATEQLTRWLASPAGMAALTRLELNDCAQLQVLDLHSLGKLQVLQLQQCCQLQTLSKSLTRLAGLRQLILSDCPRAGALPAGLGRLLQLEELVCESCAHIGELPASLTALTGLQRLLVRDCWIVSMPALTNLRGLTELDLRGTVPCAKAAAPAAAAAPAPAAAAAQVEHGVHWCDVPVQLAEATEHWWLERGVSVCRLSNYAAPIVVCLHALTVW
jgi:hypothetical protein